MKTRPKTHRLIGDELSVKLIQNRAADTKFSIKDNDVKGRL